MGPDDARHDHPGGAEAVGVSGKGISAKEFQEPMQLALGVVEASRTGPAVRAAVDGLVAVGVDDPTQLPGQ